MGTGTIVLNAILGVLFLATGSPKIIGVRYFARAFEKFGYPQWLRVFAGVSEFIGAGLLLAGIWYPTAAPVGGLLIFPTMCGATYTNYVTVNNVNGTGTLVITGLVALSVYLSVPAAAAALGMTSPW